MRLLFVIDTFFPYGVAISSRARCFCTLFHSLGYDVHVISLCTKAVGLKPGQIRQYDDCSFETVSDKEGGTFSTFCADPALLRAVKRDLAKNGADLLFSTACFPYFSALAKLAKSYGIPYLVEQCEWHDTSNYKFGKIDPRYLRANALRKGGYRKCGGVISISRLLDEHYKKIGVPSIRIPTILDVRGFPLPERKKNEKITVVYTGNPGKSKELLGPVVQTLAESEDLRRQIEFHVYGASEKTVKENVGSPEAIRKAGQSLIVHGQVPQTQIAGILAQADYQLFVRPDRRSSNAGFPTKLGESMAQGTPVITNDTGDVCLYLKDGENGFVLADNTAQSVRNVFEKICRLQEAEQEKMRENARKTAETAFDYRAYAEAVREYVARISR